MWSPWIVVHGEKKGGVRIRHKEERAKGVTRRIICVAVLRQIEPSSLESMGKKGYKIKSLRNYSI